MVYGRAEVQHNRQVDELRAQPDIGDIRDPELIYSCERDLCGQIRINRQIPTSLQSMYLFPWLAVLTFGVHSKGFHVYDGLPPGHEWLEHVS